MTKVTRSGQTDVYYDYDAMGRLLRRREMTAGTQSLQETRHFYWVGLNMIAEEVVADFYPDHNEPSWVDTNDDPEVDGGWDNLGTAVSGEYVHDAARDDEVTSLTASGYFGTDLGFWHLGDDPRLDDDPEHLDDPDTALDNPNGDPLDTTAIMTDFWIKNRNASEERMFSLFRIENSDGEFWDLVVHYESGTNSRTEGYYTVYRPDLEDAVKGGRMDLGGAEPDGRDGKGPRRERRDIPKVSRLVHCRRQP